MAKNNAIIEIEGSDLISESMRKINDNFKILAEQEEQDKYKWDSYVESIKEEVDSLKQEIDLKNIDISRTITGFAEKIDSIPTQDDIQAMVDNTLKNTKGILSSIVQKLTNVYVDEYLDENKVAYDDGWLTNAFDEIAAGGGVLLTGNLFVGDSKGRATAGMMGANNSSDNLRFFAGSSNFNSRESAPFRVYKSGKLIARNAEFIDGKFSGALSFPFKSLNECSTVIAQDITPDSRFTYGSFLRTISLSSGTSISIDISDRYAGDYYGSGGGKSQFLVLPSSGVEDGTIINIISPYSLYKNNGAPVYISADKTDNMSDRGCLFYETNPTGSYFGSSFLSVSACIDSNDSMRFSDSKWLSFRDTFFLRVLYYSGNYYVLQSLGEYTVETTAPPTGPIA